MILMSDGASPSGKAAGFGPAISEVRILSPQILKLPNGSFLFNSKLLLILSHNIAKHTVLFFA